MDQNTGLIETWKAKQFAQNVYHLSQQKGSRLASLVRTEMVSGSAEFFDRLSTATAQAKGARNADTPNLNIVHSRRMVVPSIYEWATLVDRQDKLNMIHAPESEYAKSAMFGLGRKMDDVIISAALMGAATGEAGASTEYLVAADGLASIGASSNAIDYLNVQALKHAKLIMDRNEVEGQRNIVCRAIDIQNLLGDSTVTSADYNTVKALVQGEVNTFLGFNFVRTEALIAPDATMDTNDFIFNFTSGVGAGLYSAGGTHIGASYSSYKTAFAFVGDGLILGMQEGTKSRIEERSDKSYDIQVYASMNFGAVRMEEKKIVPIFVKA